MDSNVNVPVCFLSASFDEVRWTFIVLLYDFFYKHLIQGCRVERHFRINFSIEGKASQPERKGNKEPLIGLQKILHIRESFQSLGNSCSLLACTCGTVVDCSQGGSQTHFGSHATLLPKRWRDIAQILRPGASCKRLGSRAIMSVEC